MKTCYTLFRGGGGADIGLEAAGYTSIGGIENNLPISVVCDENFPHAPTLWQDICRVDPYLLPERPTHLHASPSCRNASQANTDAGEAPEDRDAGAAVERFIGAWLPQTMSLENVWGYRHFDAFKGICAALTRLGYSYEYWHLNAAGYGVPQTRKRLILLARRGQCRIQRPPATHCEGGDWFSAPWVGWYEAIKDLVPTLPASAFAPWQLERLGIVQSSLLVQGSNTNTNSPGGICTRYPDEPMYTVVADALRCTTRAFILDCQDSGATQRQPLRSADAPMYTVSATMEPKRPARAFLVGDQGAEWGGIGVQMRMDDEPAMTLRADVQAQSRAWLSTGRVVRMTPRALARFQSIPDSYWLPDRAQLACQIIGNAVPPLLMQRIVESL